jgi:hypothetical protein
VLSRFSLRFVAVLVVAAVAGALGARFEFHLVAKTLFLVALFTVGSWAGAPIDKATREIAGKRFDGLTIAIMVAVLAAYVAGSVLTSAP